MALNPLEIKKLIKAAEPGKFTDSGGLMLVITKTGAAVWRQKYFFGGVEKVASFGPFPSVGLAEARTMRDELKAALRAGRDPNAEKKAAKQEALASRAATFAHFAQALMKQLAPEQKPGTKEKWDRHLGYAIARFGDRPVNSITPVEILDFLTEFEERGKGNTARGIMQKMGRVFRRAGKLGACQGDPISLLAGELRPARNSNFPALTQPKPFGEMLRAVWGYGGDATTRLALRMMAYTAQRPHMVREMRWEHINWQAKRWELPAAAMKGTEAQRRDHIVPLSAQAMEVLEEMRRITGNGLLVFPARGYRERPLSPGTLSGAMLRLGYDRVHVPHGFRASANTMIKEQLGRRLKTELGVGEDLQKVIDLQLAHVEPNEVRRAYDRVQWIEERGAMLQAWADYCDQLRAGGEVVALREPRQSVREKR